jgi:predicted O-methyltransferase YrrM
MIMERKLLAQDGLLLADNVLAQGCTVDSSAGNPQDSTVRNGVELRKFNDHIAEVYLSDAYLTCRMIAWMSVFFPCSMVLHL